MVVVGASAGGIEPLRRVVAGVPAELPVAFIVALHLRADSFSALRRPRPRHQLPVGHAVDGEPLRGGQVYVRPPDVDVIVRSAELHLVHGPTENGHRPAIGPLFRSAAQAYGERAIGVVVSGVLDDGTAGLAMVKHAGGVAIVQSPTDAVYAAMPRTPCAAWTPTWSCRVGTSAPLVARLVAEGSPPAGEQVEAGPDVVQEAIAEETPASGLHDGGASGLTCPDCSGARWEVHEGHHEGPFSRRARRGPRRGCSRSRPRTWKRRCGSRSVRSASAPSSRAGSTSARPRGHEHAARVFRDRLREFDSDARLLRDVLTRREDNSTTGSARSCRRSRPATAKMSTAAAVRTPPRSANDRTGRLAVAEDGDCNDRPVKARDRDEGNEPTEDDPIVDEPGDIDAHDRADDRPDEHGDDELGGLLEFVKRSRRFDFSGYKRATLQRRIAKRLQETGCDDYAAYQDYLEVHPDEFIQFFDTLLINVTSFFRDSSAWQFVAEEIVPRIISGKAPGAPIRVWSAGCATGEEAYTIAMVLADALGGEQFRERVKIYGTDVDEAALTRARMAMYSPRDLESTSTRLVREYFEPIDGSYTFRKDLRRSVIFGRHDLVQDAPISRLDLLACRNTLM